MADITIGLSNINKTKVVKIDPLGDFKVRPLGAGESLDLSAKERRLNEAFLELEKFDPTSIQQKDVSEEEKMKLLDEMRESTDKLMDEIVQIRRWKMNLFMRTFDDGGTGRAKELFDQLTESSVRDMIDQIFAPQPLTEKQEMKKEENA